MKSVFGEIPAIAATGTDFLPFTPGNKWTYSIQSVSGFTTYTVSAISRSEILSSNIARFESTVGERSVQYQLIAESNRIFRRNRPDKADSPWVLELLIPEYGGTEQAGSVQYRTLGFEEVVTPAGTFANCVRVQIRSADNRVVDVWYAPKVGMVKRVNVTSKITEILEAFRKG